MKTSVAIVGGGILGSWVARLALRSHCTTTLFTKNTSSPFASLAAGGLLCPYTEMESSEKEIAVLGLNSFALWDEVHEETNRSFVYHKRGTLAVHHRSDFNQSVSLEQRLHRHGLEKSCLRVDGQWLRDHEPTLHPNFSEAFFFPDERNLEAIPALNALRAAFVAAGGNVISNDGVDPLSLTRHYDWVIDCRGIEAKKDLPTLRAVRGERVTLYAPEVELSHTVRLLHPMTPLYIAPLDQHRFVVGATAVESEDASPFKVRSMLEILSAAYSIDSGFAESEILETWVSHRPAFPDNLPRIEKVDRLVRVNGLYRHGYLLAPAVASQVVETLGLRERAA